MKTIICLATLLASFAVFAEESNVCIQIAPNFPEGGYKNYKMSFLSSPGQIFKLGDTLTVIIAPVFPAESNEAPIQKTVKYVSNAGNILQLQDDNKTISVQIDRSKSDSGAPFMYSANINVNVGDYKFSSAETPSYKDPHTTYKVTYLAMMLNPQFRGSDQSWGQLVACSFK